jgi:CRP-like cAMP-binding protein
MFKRDPFGLIADNNRVSTSDLVEAILKHSTARDVRFEPGDVLRQKGLHYRDMFLTVAGTYEVDFETEENSTKVNISDSGTPIGEIGFLRGSTASATVRAVSAGAGILIDDNTYEKLEHDQPAIASQFLHRLAQVAEERTSFNFLTGAKGPAYTTGLPIEVLLCRTGEMLRRAQRLRYEVYCEELGRQSPYADHEQKIITDDLDSFGNTFVAIENGKIIGTLRGNEADAGPLGILEDLYGMKDSVHHPRATAICTKFVISKSKRGGPAALKLIAAIVSYGLRRHIRECYMDCIPSLLPYYKAMGFVPSGQRFFHRENGPSDPMRLDLKKHGKRLTGEMGFPSYLALFTRAQLIKVRSKIPKMITGIQQPTS